MANTWLIHGENVVDTINSRNAEKKSQPIYNFSFHRVRHFGSKMARGSVGGGKFFFCINLNFFIF